MSPEEQWLANNLKREAEMHDRSAAQYEERALELRRKAEAARKAVEYLHKQSGT